VNEDHKKLGLRLIADHEQGWAELLADVEALNFAPPDSPFRRRLDEIAAGPNEFDDLIASLALAAMSRMMATIAEEMINNEH
jgi:hypothetical protein